MKANTQQNNARACGQSTPRVRVFWAPKEANGAPSVTIEFLCLTRREVNRLIRTEYALRSLGLWFEDGNSSYAEHRASWLFDWSISAEHYLWAKATKTYQPVEPRILECWRAAQPW